MNALTKDCPVIAFTAGKGGCGKTTLSVNFAYTLFKAGKRVLLIDADLSNRGSTGLFANNLAVNNAPRQLSMCRLLTPEIEDNSFESYSLTAIRPAGYFFIPVSVPGDEINIERLEDTSLDNSILVLKDKLQRIAKMHQIDCIILDCFCGIDVMTTTAVCLSDDAIFINEPDIVTFTGTIFLHRHILGELTKLPESFNKPRIHLVINRMKPDFSVSDLNKIYADNLLTEFPNGAECHFPYNERIFKNFGKYPFWEDLIPGSLFIKKMRLLTWQIFQGTTHEDLLTPNVRNWKQDQVAALYLKSKDYTAIDAETLVLQLTDLMMFAGLLIGFYFIAVDYLNLAPLMTALLFITLTILSVIVYCSNLIWPVVLITRLNFSIAVFQYRLRQHTGKLHVDNLAPIGFRLLKTIIMAFSSLMIAFVLLTMLYELSGIFGFGETSGNQSKRNPFAYLVSTTIPRAALSKNDPFRSMDLTSSTVSSINFTDSLYNFYNCRISGTTGFDNCTFNLDTIQKNTALLRSQIKNSLIIVNNRFQNALGSGLPAVLHEVLMHTPYNPYMFNYITIIGEKKPDEVKQMIFKFVLLNQIDSIETSNGQAKSLNNFVIFKDTLRKNIFADANRFIQKNDYQGTAGNLQHAKLLIFLKDSATVKLQFSPRAKVLFFKFRFPNNLQPVSTPDILVYKSTPSTHEFDYSSLSTTLKFILKTLTDERRDSTTYGNSGAVRLANLTELNILVNEPGLNAKIGSEISKLKQFPQDSYSYKRGLFLDILWKLNTGKKDSLSAAVTNWINWCNSVNHSSDGPKFDQWDWDYWIKYNYQKVTINFSPEKYKLVVALAATESDKFHTKETDLSKSTLAKDIAALDAARQVLQK